MAHPIRHRRAGDFGEVGLVCRIPILTCKEHIFFPLLGGRLDQAAIGTLIAVYMVCTAHKGGGLHHFAANFFKGSCAQMSHVDGFGQHHLFAELFKAGKEHPAVLRYHSLKTVVGGHLAAALNKDSKQVSFAVRVILLDEVVDICAQVAGSGIRRIRASDPILPRHRFTNITKPC